MGIFTPNAEVIVWNYENRFSSTKLSDPGTIAETLLLSSYIQRIATSKQKGAPAGSFEISLAPAFNWISKITPGSWCAIIMSSKEDVSKVTQADRRNLKMLGRIDAIRVVAQVDSDGTRTLSYIVTGTDWANVFETTLYIDPIVLQSATGGMNQLGAAQALIYANWINNVLSTNKPIPSTTDNVKQLINIWGEAGTGYLAKLSANIPVVKDLALSSGDQYHLPKEVAKYLQIGSTTLNGALKIVPGKLIGPDKYEDVREAHVFIEPSSVSGAHSLWQLINDNCNNILNECIAEMRWDSDKNVNLTLYKRTRPFLNRAPRPPQKEPEVERNLSFFKDVLRHTIPIEDILSCNAGTNWRDSVNFIEIMPANSLLQTEIISNEAKLKAQEADKIGFLRDGMRAMILSAPYVIYPEGRKQTLTDFTALTQWKWLLKEWYFNTQNLLNGSITFVGQNTYIGVGDNIMFDASILGYAPFNTKQTQNTQILAHVENLSHDFSVNEEGARTFFTTINFVRGIPTDAAGNPVDPKTGIATDPKASQMPESTETQSNVIISRSK